MSVCFDNMVLIWGVRKEAAPGQRHLIDRTAELISSIQKRGEDIIIPASVLGEYLLGTPPSEHRDVLQVFYRRFQIVPYDAPSAALAAVLWHEVKDGPMRHEEWLQGKARNELKVDCQFVATAIVHRASCIYSHDPHISKIANGRIEVLEVPKFMDQTVLFGSTKSET